MSGAVTVSASASDNVGVSRVEFYVDGTLKNSDTASPYSYSLDSTQLSNAAHALTAKAYDAAGNAGTSASVSVTVNNVVPDTNAANELTISTVSPSSAALVTLSLAWGRTMSVSIPAGSFAGDAVITLRVPYFMPVPTSMHNPALQATGIGMEITLDQAVQPVKAATLEVTYTDAEMAGVDRSKLVLARYDEGAKGWIPLESVSYPKQNKVTGKTTHFSLFQVMVLSAGVNLNGAHIYPNPFYPNKGHTQVSMDGLPEGTAVKVYTLNGELVWEGKASAAGLAVWYGRNKAGRKVASGLYLVHLESGGQKKIKKVSVVK